MIPIFPVMKKIELSDKREIESLVSSYPCYSDFNFTSLWSYDTDHKAEISLLHSNLVIKFQDYIDLELFYSFLGTSNTEETIDLLLLHAQQEGIKTHLHLVPHSVAVNVIGNPKYVINEDRDNFDYMISAPDFSLMEGGRYHKKRNMVSRFIREYGNAYEFVALDLTDPSIQHEIIRIFHVWEQVFHKTSAESHHELVAIYKLFEGLDVLNLQAFGIKIHGELEAFLIAEVIHDSCAIRHFEKPNVTFHGITEFLQKETARIFAEQGCLYINYEQDLGLPGLREAKTLCHPTHFLKKYTIHTSI